MVNDVVKSLLIKSYIIIGLVVSQKKREVEKGPLFCFMVNT